MQNPGQYLPDQNHSKDKIQLLERIENSCKVKYMIQPN